MTFLNPTNLWFLSFLIIPIIFHLLNLLKNKKEDFSSLILIKELKKTSMRNVKLKKLILLLLRILGIILLVISFSKPVTNSFLHSWSTPELESRLYIVRLSFKVRCGSNSIIIATIEPNIITPKGRTSLSSKATIDEKIIPVSEPVIDLVPTLP